ncbi:hypothetical protein J14TS2_12770 [Bacillus sp. J14TS2]|nr:hypothetical protein J14TS2_12770 [Bacillus sp. J14TS2]
MENRDNELTSSKGMPIVKAADSNLAFPIIVNTIVATATINSSCNGKVKPSKIDTMDRSIPTSIPTGNKCLSSRKIVCTFI